MINYGEKEDDADIAVRKMLKNVFTHGEGPQALTFILQELGYFDEALDDADRVRKNYAINLLDNIGLNHVAHQQDMVDALLKVPVYWPGRVEEDA